MNPLWIRAIEASASSAAVPPYLAGGAPSPIAVYDPMGAASQAASYVNIVNPGTFDAAPGVAPTWAAGTGWGLDGTQYLTTGIIPGAGYSYVVRFSDAPANNARALIGSFSNVGSTHVRLVPYDVNRTIYANGGGVAVSDGGTFSGVLGMADNTAYKNGTSQGTMAAWSGTATREIYIGARNNQGTADGFAVGNIQYLIIYPTSTGHATWLPAVSAAVAAL